MADTGLGTNDQATGATGESTGQAAQVAQGAGVAGQASGGAVGQGLDYGVGNEKFATLDDLKRGYSDLHKGFTQKTQEYSAKVKAYESIQGWLDDIRRDPSRWKRFSEYLDSAGEKPVAAQAQREDPRLESLENSLAGTKLRLEVMQFKQQHQDLAEDDVNAVLEEVLKRDDKGQDISMEDAFRISYFGKQAARAASDAQKKTEDALQRGKEAGSLAASATGAQGQRPAPRLSELSSESDQVKWYKDKAKELGMSFRGP